MESSTDFDAIVDRARCADKALFALNKMIGDGKIDWAELRSILEGKS